MSNAKFFRGPTALLLFAATVSAQAGQEDQKRVQGAQEDPGGIPIASPNVTDHGFNALAHGLFFAIHVKQDPMRVAPGESGKLILIVTISSGDEIDAGGSMQLKAQQGPVKLSGGIWDSLPPGQMRHKDTFLIQVPFKVDPKTSYGTYPIRGTVHLTGRFKSGASLPPGVEAVNADSTGIPGGGGVVQNGSSRPLLTEYSKATGNFSHEVRVGAALPIAGPPLGRRAPAGKNLAGANKSKATVAEQKAAPITSRGKSEIRLPSSVDDPESNPPGREHRPTAPAELLGGIPTWTISLGLVLLAGLVFFMQKRR